MKHISFVFLFYILSHTAQSQGTDWRIGKFTHDNGIKTFWTYNFSCNYDLILDDCSWEVPYYIFWKQHGKWNIKRFDYCHTYKTIHQGTYNSFNSCLHYFSEINIANFSTPNKDTSLPHRFICLYTIEYHSNGQTKKFIQDKYYMDAETIYTTATTNRLKAMITFIEKLLQQLNDENAFVIE